MTTTRSRPNKLSSTSRRTPRTRSARGDQTALPRRRVWNHGPVSIERINPAELGRPSGFSHAVSATGGRLVFLAGQTGYGPDGQIAGGGVVPQFERALGNLLVALRAAGGQPRDLVSPTISAGALEDYPAHRPAVGDAG